MHKVQERARPRYRINGKKLLGRLVLAAFVLGLVLFALFLIRKGTKNATSFDVVGPESSLGEVDFLMLVNWENPVPFDRPDGLVSLKDALGDSAKLQTPDGSVNGTAGEAAKEMFEAAKEDGITDFFVTTAYRSVAYQNQLFNARVADDPDYGSHPYDNPVKVLPGECSEHTTGLAIDILAADYCDADNGYADTSQGSWLSYTRGNTASSCATRRTRSTLQA